MTLVDDIRAWCSTIEDLPPRPYLIRADHRVPYGQGFKQWDTSGRMVLWVNRGWVADLPRSSEQGVPLLGIPVTDA